MMRCHAGWSGTSVIGAVAAALGLVAMMLVSLAFAVPSSARGSSQPEALPSDAVARVGSRLILKADFDHWLAIAAATGHEPVPGPDSPRYPALRVQAMWLIGYVWVQEEAAERHISVSAATVRRAFRRQKRELFATE